MFLDSFQHEDFDTGSVDVWGESSAGLARTGSGLKDRDWASWEEGEGSLLDTSDCATVTVSENVFDIMRDG